MIASATAADCVWSWASCWVSAMVRCSARRSTNQAARRGRQGPTRRLDHSRQGLAGAAISGSQALGLPQPMDIGSNRSIAAHIAALTEVAKQPHGGVAPRIPALEEIGLIGVKGTLAEVAATSAPGEGSGAKITLDRAQTQSDLLRNGRGRPTLA